ncbi:MAG: sulfatase-like hydrolase/transferase [Verrucomicrobia bacterium]|nr:sulfatase-like hydrolase/transferase [Verrucomicrobiota bacterium]
MNFYSDNRLRLTSHFLRRSVLGGLLSLSALVFLVRAEKANVVMIMADDIGFECFGSYGSTEYSTPRIDSLASGGIQFNHCHSTPLCTPSRVNLLSGKSNVFNYEDFGVYPKGEPTFANYFKGHGYATGVAGKWQLMTKSGGLSANEAGFDTYCLWNTPKTERTRYWDPSYEMNGKLIDLPPDTYGPDIMTEFLIRFIEENRDRPFLAYYPMNLVHSPFPPTPDSVDRQETDEKKNFVDMVAYMDKCVGRLVDVLEAFGLRDKTLIVFTGDNGTHDRLISNLNGGRVRGGKGFTHDYGTHVPLILNWPGRILAGQTNEDLICFSDFFPTLVESVGLPARLINDGDGWSFWPQCVGSEGKRREWIYGYYFPRPYAQQFDRKYQHFEVRYARDKRFKLYGNGQLFDTVSDVLEKSPISLDSGSSESEVARKRLTGVLKDHPSRGRGIDYNRVNGKMP